MSNKLYAIVVGVITTLFIIFHSIVLLAASIFLLIISYIIYRNKQINIDNLYKTLSMSNNVYTYVENNKFKASVMFKLILKNNDNYYIQQLNSLINALSHRESSCEYYIINRINKRAGAVLLITAINDDKEKAEEFVINEAKLVLSLAKGVCPSLEFYPVGQSNVFIPIPSQVGNLTFTTITEYVPSLPSRNKILTTYEIELGELNDGFDNKIGLRLQDLTKHLAIFGATGSGKSTTSLKLIKEVRKKGVNVVVIDWHGEYAEKLINEEYILYNTNNPFKINPLSSSDVDDITEIFGDVFQLTEPQRYVLFSAIRNLKKVSDPKPSLLLDAIYKIDETSYWQREIKYALIRKLYLLSSKEARNILSEKGCDISALFSDIDKIKLFDLSFISSIKLRRIYTLMLIKLINEYIIKNRKDFITLVVLEEAHNYIIKGNLYIESLLAEIRKFNIALCIISQSPSSLSDAVMKNTSIKIIHSIKADVDKRIIRDSMSIDSELYSILDKLPYGVCILQAPNILSPVIINVK
ncbi:hypothetical protein HS7_07720 [Sulfolobales archaeon HS-7]|nr:hypothetical protein HS7_07720 [Sulfolobales archaeon HS-7]